MLGQLVPLRLCSWRACVTQSHFGTLLLPSPSAESGSERELNTEEEEEAKFKSGTLPSQDKG